MKESSFKPKSVWPQSQTSSSSLYFIVSSLWLQSSSSKDMQLPHHKSRSRFLSGPQMGYQGQTQEDSSPPLFIGCCESRVFYGISNIWVLATIYDLPDFLHFTIGSKWRLYFFPEPLIKMEVDSFKRKNKIFQRDIEYLYRIFLVEQTRRCDSIVSRKKSKGLGNKEGRKTYFSLIHLLNFCTLCIK